MTSNDLLQKPPKTSTTKTKSYQSRGYQNGFMQIHCRLNLSLLSVQGEKKKYFKVTEERKEKDRMCSA